MSKFLYGINSFILIGALLYTYYGIKKKIEKDKEKRSAVADLLSYFTVLSNILVLFYWGLKIFEKDIIFLEAPIRLYISITCIVYCFILFPRWKPKGLYILSNFIVHLYVPFIVWYNFIIENQKNKISILEPIFWLIMPVIYLILVTIRGYKIKKYPYFFLDRKTIGNKKYVTFMVSLILLFIISGYIIYVIS